MKNLITKVLHRKNKPVSTPSRITTETVAEHRERVLAGGRRYKYPIQYAKHKLVINAILISFVALVAIVATVWWQLYPQQNTSDFFYRITKVLPLPVANINGQPVLYSDYLMKYLSSAHYLENIEQVDLESDDGRRQADYLKQQSMDDAIADAYAQKMSKSLDISVSQSDVDDFIKMQRQTGDGETSQQTYNAVIRDYYGWSPDEYRHVVWSKLLRQRVAYAMDDVAKDISKQVSEAIGENDLKTVYDKLSLNDNVSYGVSGWVPKDNQDGGLSIEASKLEKGQTSNEVTTTKGDGYYYVRVLDINDTQVSYEYLNIKLTEFNNSLNDVIDDNKLDKYISINS